MTHFFFLNLHSIKKILTRVDMLTCHPCCTQVDTKIKPSSDGELASDLNLYRSLAGALQYLIFTFPDISYGIQQPLYA